MTQNKTNFKLVWFVLAAVVLLLLVLPAASQLIANAIFPSPTLEDIYQSIFDEKIEITDRSGTVPADGAIIPSIHYYTFAFKCNADLQPGSGIKTFKNLKNYFVQVYPTQIPEEIFGKFPQIQTKAGVPLAERYTCWYSQLEGPDNICGTWIIHDLKTHYYYAVKRYRPWSRVLGT